MSSKIGRSQQYGKSQCYYSKMIPRNCLLAIVFQLIIQGDAKGKEPFSEVQSRDEMGPLQKQKKEEF